MGVGVGVWASKSELFYLIFIFIFFCDSIVYWYFDTTTGTLSNQVNQVNLIDSTNLDVVRSVAVSPDRTGSYIFCTFEGNVFALVVRFPYSCTSVNVFFTFLQLFSFRDVRFVRTTYISLLLPIHDPSTIMFLV